jgi:hypothetical protein
MGSKATYYYTGETKVSLEPDETHVALDMKLARKKALTPKELEALRTHGTQLKGDLYLISRHNLPSTIQSRLEEMNVLQPVFRHEDTLIVVLPEVRAETEGSREAEALQAYTSKRKGAVKMDQKRTGQFVLWPTSGQGTDALDLANELHEKVHLGTVQARFVRMVPRPKAKKTTPER